MRASRNQRAHISPGVTLGAQARSCSALALLCVGVLLSLFVAHAADAQLRPRTLGPLGSADSLKSERQREQVITLARRKLGRTVDGTSLADLDALQRLIDERHVAQTDTFAQQCLGVVLGDVMASTLRLEWVVVDDEHGRSRALRRKGQQEIFFPVTMISKRMKFGEQIDVRALYQQVAEQVAVLDRRS
jgi:hypothetical protein